MSRPRTETDARAARAAREAGRRSDDAPLEIETDLGGLRVYRHVDWAARFPGLVQGVTARADHQDFGKRSPGTAGGGGGDAADASPPDAWWLLQRATRVPRVARCRQVHGAEVAVCRASNEAGVQAMGEADALVTRHPGVLLAVTVADCVPVFIVDPRRRLLGLAHAGWRGVAAGVAEAAVDAICGLGGDPGELYVHLGPAICGACYEVGPEVAAALGQHSAGRVRVDLRAVVSRALLAVGVDAERLTVSRRCTRHEREAFFSHRGKDASRRMCAFLGWASG